MNLHFISGRKGKHIRSAIFLIISIVKTQRYEVKISDLNSQKTSGFIKEAIRAVSGAPIRFQHRHSYSCQALAPATPMFST